MYFGMLTGNAVVDCGLLAWFLAQLIKVILDLALLGKMEWQRFFSSGGMPSSHSSTVCALVVSSGIRCGVSSPEFAVSFVLAAVVMYDAIGVRQETGKQAKLLNMILEQDFFKLNNREFQKKLKEFVGHTPLQVLAGAVLGVVIALLVNMAY